MCKNSGPSPTRHSNSYSLPSTAPLSPNNPSRLRTLWLTIVASLKKSGFPSQVAGNKSNPYCPCMFPIVTLNSLAAAGAMFG
jgi:hypothetical protein